MNANVKSPTNVTNDQSSMRMWHKRPWLLFVVGLLVGTLGLLTIRFATYTPEHTHYHANFAVYLNGTKYDFKGPQYYQEVAICSNAKGIVSPAQRAHMHDNINSVIHVHDHTTTWGQFFENIGWYIGPDFVETDTGTMYRATDNQKLHIIINGQDYTDLTPITNVVIGDQSKLLVSFGNIDAATLQQEYKTVPSSAKHFDETTDPLSCSGAEKITVSDRLRHLF